MRRYLCGRLAIGTVRRAGQLSDRARRVIRISLAGALVAGLIGIGLMSWQWSADIHAEAGRWAALQSAKTRTEQLLSYNSHTLDADLARGRAQVTGDFATQYERTASELIGPATRAKEIVTVATVVRSALISAEPDRVETLLYINQATTSKEQPTPRPVTSQVRVTVSRVGDQWLISGMQPI